MKTGNTSESFLPTISARDLALVILKRKWSILVIIVTAMLGAVVWLWGVRDDMYKSYAKVLVKLGREQATPPTVMGASPALIGYRSQEVNSEIDIFQNIESIGRVVDRLHLDQPVQEPVPD